MSTEKTPSTEATQAMTPGERWFLTFWVAGLAGLVVAVALYGVGSLHRSKVETVKEREAWMAYLATDSLRTPPGEMAPDSALPAAPARAAVPVDVRIGMILDRIGEIDARESALTAEFRLWFRWKGAAVAPGEHFEIANGNIVERERLIAAERDGERYEMYRVTARMTKRFDTARFPLGDEAIAILIVDREDGIDRLRYVAGPGSIDVRRVVAPQGLTITNVIPAVKVRLPETGQADLDSRRGQARSIFVAAMTGQSAAAGKYVRMFQALFASVAISLIVFFIKPTHVDPRFGLPVGAFFAAVGNNSALASIVPESSRVNLVQLVNAVSLGAIFLALVQSAISLYVLDSLGRERFSRIFDQVTFVLVAAGYVLLNVLLPLAAR